MRMVIGAAAITVTTLAGCAKSPDKIAAVDIGPNAYASYSCAQLATQKMKISHDLENLSAAQKSAATGDAWGVFLLGLPVSSMSGNDKEAAISIAKGHIQAIELEMQRKNCR